MAVASTSEETFGFLDHVHAAEGFAFVGFLVKFALEAIIVELASLALGTEGTSYQINRQP